MRIYPLMRDFLASKVGCDGCWEYPGTRDKDGYSYYYDGDSDPRAHREAYAIAIGRIPDGMYVCHRCDNRPCCRPSHLFLGTARDNACDAVSKDRHSRGERNGISKLTAQQVLAIRADHRRQVAIAADYGIRQTTVSEIKRGNRWRHLDGHR